MITLTFPFFLTQRPSSRSNHSSSISSASSRSGTYRHRDRSRDPLDPVYEYHDRRGRRHSRQFTHPDPHAFDTKDSNDQGGTKKQFILIALAVFLFMVIVAIIAIVVIMGECQVYYYKSHIENGNMNNAVLYRGWSCSRRGSNLKLNLVVIYLTFLV